MSDLAHRLGASLQRVRETTGLSQTDVAHRIGKKQSILSEWETGRKTVSLTKVAELERAMNVPLGSVLADAGFVDLPSVTTRSALANDPDLLAGDRAYLLRIYDEMRVHREAARSGHGAPDGPERPPEIIGLPSNGNS